MHEDLGVIVDDLLKNAQIYGVTGRFLDSSPGDFDKFIEYDDKLNKFMSLLYNAEIRDLKRGLIEKSSKLLEIILNNRNTYIEKLNNLIEKAEENKKSYRLEIDDITKYKDKIYPLIDRLKI